MRATESRVDITNCVDIVREEAPSIMEQAASSWRERGLQIPPTQIIFASVDPSTGMGTHVSIRLNQIEVATFDEPGPYFTGTNTPLIREKASEEWHRRMQIDKKHFGF